MTPGRLRLICRLLLLLSAAVPVMGQNVDDESDFFTISEFELERLPGGYFYQNFFENLAPDVTSLIEESNGFAQIDAPKIYFEGDSFTQSNWFFDGFSINSALTDGAPAFQLPLLAIGSMALSGESPRRRGYGFHFQPRQPTAFSSKLMVSTVFADVGGYTDLGKWAIGNHASLRADDLYSGRRRISGNQTLDVALETGSAVSSFLLAAGYFSIDRRFNDFNVRDAQFGEDGSMLQVLSRWQRRYAAGTLALALAVNDVQRGRLFAEDGRYPQETHDSVRDTVFAGLSWRGRPFDLRLSWQMEWEQRSPNDIDAGKDLRDIDGQAFFPFEKWGRFQAHTLALDIERNVPLSLLGRPIELRPYLDFKTVLANAEERHGAANAVFFAGEPYQAIEWNGGGAYSHSRLLGSAGALLAVPLLPKVSFAARLFLQYQGLFFESAGQGGHFLEPGVDLGITFAPGKRTALSLSYGNLPYELRADASDFLEDQRPGATLYYWQDGSGDGLFQDAEKGDVYGTIGGPSHAPAPDLMLPRRERVLLQLVAPLWGDFRLHVKGLYKKIHQPLWVHFAEDYGHYEEISGRDFYFIDRPFTAFELGNADFSKDPFYAQLLLRLEGRKAGRWFFSFSFLAHMGMGYTAFGNGPTANDIGIISESQAFPNTWINGYGRVDGDRAFVGKVFFGHYICKRLFLSGSVKYRDGNPFAFMGAFKENGQWIITYQTIRGEDEHGVKGGPREDCVWDFNFKLNYEFSLFGKKGRLELAVFNLLDFGLELSENVFTEESRRLANELQLPRSLRLGLELEI
jgi:hypothetical protein